MSLTIYTDRKQIPAGVEIIEDNDAQFAFTGVKVNDTTKALVKEIDEGDLVSASRFVDRFGVSLYTSELSTGSKTAINVDTNPDKVVNVVECGLNAITSIVENCRTGMILNEYECGGYGTGLDVNIDIIYNGVHYTNSDDFEEIFER